MKATDAFVKEDERKARVVAQGDRPRVKIPWFKLDVNQSSKVRFLWELTDGIGLFRHSRNEKPFAVSCFQNEEYVGDSAGGDCPFCTEGARKSVEFFWMVYNYTTQQVEILSFRDTAYTPVGLLRSFFEENQTVTDRDFTIRRVPAASRTGDGRQVSSYMAIPNAPSGFLVTNLQVPGSDDLINYLRPFELGRGEGKN